MAYAKLSVPRGSVYHHFPEGRSQLLIEALQFAGDAIAAHIDASAAYGGIALVRGFVTFWDRILADSAAAQYFNFRKLSIFGGSNEIQRGIIAKSLLGL